MEESQSPTTPAVPRVSALVLSYNNAAGLKRCLEALEASTIRPQMEVLVMENGSTDGSMRLDTDFPHATFMRLPRNFGATKALNIGMRTAAGEYFLYLSTEIEVAPDTVAKLAAVLDADANAAAVCPLVVDPAGTPAGDIWRIPSAAALKQAWRDPQALPRMTVPTEGDAVEVEYAGRRALMARKFFVRGLNYFDERYGEFGADLDLAYQIRRGGRKTLLLPSARGTLHPRAPLPRSAESTLLADRASGIARYLSKHQGAAAGIAFQVGATLGSLARLKLGLVASIASGSKIDGSQGEL